MDYYFGLPKAVLIVSGVGAVAEAVDQATGLPILKELSAVLQFGAFGLCALMMCGVWMLLKLHREERKELVKSLEKKEAENKELAISSIQALNNIADAMKSLKNGLDNGGKKGG